MPPPTTKPGTRPRGGSKGTGEIDCATTKKKHPNITTMIPPPVVLHPPCLYAKTMTYPKYPQPADDLN